MTIRSIRILYTAGPPVVGIDVAFCAQQCWRLRGWPCALEDERCSDQIESRGTRRGPRRLDRLVSRTHSANELTRRARRCACGKDLPRNLHTSWLLRSGRPEGRTQHGQANEPAPPPPRAARASTTAAHCQRANPCIYLYLISYLSILSYLSSVDRARPNYFLLFHALRSHSLSNTARNSFCRCEPCRRRPRPPTRPRPTRWTRSRSRRRGTNTSSAAASRAPPSATRPPSTCGVCRFHRLLPLLLSHLHHQHHRHDLCTGLGCCICLDLCLRLRLHRHHCRCRLNAVGCACAVPVLTLARAPWRCYDGSGAQGEGGALCQPQRGATEAGARAARHLLLLTTYHRLLGARAALLLPPTTQLLGFQAGLLTTYHIPPTTYHPLGARAGLHRGRPRRERATRRRPRHRA